METTWSGVHARRLARPGLAEPVAASNAAGLSLVKTYGPRPAVVGMARAAWSRRDDGVARRIAAH